MILTPKQYSILLDLYHEMNEVFIKLPPEVLEAFYKELYNKTGRNLA